MPMRGFTPERQCEAMSRTTGKRCGNFKHYGCRTCRFHGAHKTKGAAKGEAHWNYKDGKQCRDKLKAQSQTHKAIKDLRALALAQGLLINPRTGKPAKTLRDLEFS